MFSNYCSLCKWQKLHGVTFPLNPKLDHRIQNLTSLESVRPTLQYAVHPRKIYCLEIAQENL